MINFNIHKYCQGCVEFEPLVTQRPELLENTFGEYRFCGDTIVECKYRNRCEVIHAYLKREKDK